MTSYEHDFFSLIFFWAKQLATRFSLLRFVFSVPLGGIEIVSLDFTLNLTRSLQKMKENCFIYFFDESHFPLH